MDTGLLVWPGSVWAWRESISPFILAAFLRSISLRQPLSTRPVLGFQQFQERWATDTVVGRAL